MKPIFTRKRWMIIGILVIFVMGLSIWWYNRVMSASALPVKNKVIIVDAGHGGVDGGAVGISGVYESHINLEIALRLRRLLEESGAVAILTRDADYGLYSDRGRIRDKKNEDLKNRQELINNSEADLFISIHLNSFSQSQYYGAQTFYPKDSPDSKKLAELIQEELIRVLDNGNHRTPKTKSDTYLMKNCKLPTALVECGFLSNPMEERLLQDSEYQEKIAWSIYVGILRYFNEENK